jgi:thioredoxin reductase
VSHPCRRRKARERLSKLTTQSDGTPSSAHVSASSETNPRCVRVSAATTSEPIRSAIGSRERAPYSFETSLPGVFAIGDVRHGSVKRITAGAGEGSVAVSELHRLLEAG